jgi:FMN-dependent NADH-azoreductase
MTHVLHIDASPRGKRSHTRQLSQEFIQTWKAAHPDCTVTYRDLGHNPVPPVDELWVAAAFSPLQEHTPEMQEAIKLSDALVDEFLAADLVVCGVPMYNFSVPSNFKAYIDQIVRVNRTFKIEGYHNYKGLTQGKKMVVLMASSGGGYGQGQAMESMNFFAPYLRAVFGFIGVSDITFIYDENTIMDDNSFEQVMVQARAVVQNMVLPDQRDLLNWSSP